MTYREQAVEFGPSLHLRGVLVEPSAGHVPNAPALLTWNVGLEHHVGPSRFFVELTRALAALGFTSLRFDVTNWGDSDAAVDDGLAPLERALADVREAMAALTRWRGVERFVPIGFCSGVDAAHVLSLRESRVPAVIHLEGYGYRTPGFYRRYWRRLLNRNRWERTLRLKVLRQKLPARRMSVEDTRTFVRHYPPLEQLESDVSKLVARGTRLLLVYVGGDTDYAYREQFFDVIRRDGIADGVELEFYPDADHAFFLEEDRRRVIERVADFVRRHFA